MKNSSMTAPTDIAHIYCTVRTTLKETKELQNTKIAKFNQTTDNAPC